MKKKKDDTEYSIEDVEELLMTTEGEPTTPTGSAVPDADAPETQANADGNPDADGQTEAAPTAVPTLRKILFGSFLGTDMLKRQVWTVLIVILMAILYVAFRYQNQQDILLISNMEKELQDAKYKALSSSSTLTERSRESHVLDQLKANHDSTLHQADQPPYIITVPKE